MNTLQHLFSLGAVAFAMATFSACASAEGETNKTEPNAAYFWSGIALECTAKDTELNLPRPTVTARALALVHIAAYDAWTRYDERARPVYLNNVARVPKTDTFEREKAISIGYAYARTLYTYFPDSRVEIMNTLYDLGLEFNNYSLDPNTPEGIGNLAARSVIESHRNDLSNQFAWPPYHDFTNYKPVNRYDSITDPSRWYPKPFTDNNGQPYLIDCLTPHWHWVTPFALERANQFRPAPPPSLESDTLLNETREVVQLHANLSDADKALVEFMRDGPSSVQQAGHWLIFARHLSQRDQHSIDDDVKMQLLVTVTAHDAFIACWDAKMHYDFARPQALVHHFFANDSLTGWMGEGKGWGRIKGSEWRPYSPANFLCPPFPSYPSGHSTVSGACAEALKRFKGNDRFDYEVTLMPGALTEPDATGDEVTLRFETLSETAERAGRSRVLGGYHIEADNQAGLKLGREVAQVTCDRYFRLLEGRP